MRGKRPLGFELGERILVIRRLRRQGLTVDQIAGRLEVSERTVRRGIAAFNRIARRQLALNVRADVRRDLEVLADDSARIDEALAGADPSQVANLVKARAVLLKTKHVMLRDLGERQPPADSGGLVDPGDYANWSMLELDVEYRRRVRWLYETLDPGAARTVLEGLEKSGRRSKRGVRFRLKETSDR